MLNMKILITLLFLSGSLAMPQVDIQKSNKEKPPKGFAVVSDLNLVVATTEVFIEQWLKYKFEGSSDEELVANPFNDCMASMEAYNSYQIYRDTTYVNQKGKKENVKLPCGSLPVTGVTYEQALAYCDWLTDVYASDPKLPNYTFRLPTQDEMKALLKRNLDPDGYMAKGVNSKGCALYNHKHNSWCEHNKEAKLKFGYTVPMPVGYFFPSIDGIYDLMGNVAEMTSEKGIAVGGGCVHTALECQAEAANEYSKPEFWLGFRVVADNL
jgi:formylglycine-generating enzyme required for sulfatase activity